MLTLISLARPAQEGQGDRGRRPGLGQLTQLGDPVGTLLAELG
jgi:hypothetical protein